MRGGFAGENFDLHIGENFVPGVLGEKIIVVDRDISEHRRLFVKFGGRQHHILGGSGGYLDLHVGENGGFCAVRQQVEVIDQLLGV